MPTKLPRLNVALDPRLYDTVKSLAEEDAISISQKARDLIKAALEDHEDLVLATLADERMKSFHPKTALTHKKVWAHLKKK